MNFTSINCQQVAVSHIMLNELRLRLISFGKQSLRYYFGLCDVGGMLVYPTQQ